MKNLIAGLVTALMMSMGLIAISGATSQAGSAQAAGIGTQTVVKGPRVVLRHRRPNVIVGVKAPGYGAPTGKILFVVAKVNGAFRRARTYPYEGEVRGLLGPTLDRPGRYKVTTTFFSPSGQYAGSTDSIIIRVTDSGPCPIQPPRYC